MIYAGDAETFFNDLWYIFMRVSDSDAELDQAWHTSLHTIIAEFNDLYEDVPLHAYSGVPNDYYNEYWKYSFQKGIWIQLLNDLNQKAQQVIRFTNLPDF